MLYGYARVSTSDQKAQLQLDALQAAGCQQVFVDEGISGSAATRPALSKAFAALKAGDVLVVWRLDRLGRSLSHLIQLTGQLGEQGIGFRSLTEAIDTTSSSGRLLFHIMGALAEFERNHLGANAVVGVDLDYETLGSGGSMLMVTASGTAVVCAPPGAA